MDRAAVTKALAAGTGVATIDKKNWHLQKLKQTTQVPGTILPYIERALLKRSVDSASARDKTHLHPSEMAKGEWCPRNSYYRIAGFPIEKEDKFSFSLQRIFEEGHDIHNKYQTWAWDAGILEGVFKCLIPACRHGWYAISPTECPECGESLIEYREVPLYSDTYRIIGHADGIINIKGKRFIWEIKSLGVRTLEFEAPHLYKQYEAGDLTINELWQRIKRPLPSHRRQGNIYSDLLGIPRVHYIYEWKPNQQVKEFETVVRYGDPIVAELLGKASSVVQALSNEIPPSRPEWATEKNNVCMKCPYQNECWNGKAELSEVEQPQERPIAEPTAGQRSQRIRRSRGTG